MLGQVREYENTERKQSILFWLRRIRPSLDANSPNLAVLHARYKRRVDKHHARKQLNKVSDHKESPEGIVEATGALPTAVAKGGSVSAAPSTSATAAATATAPATTAATTTSATTVANHLSETGVDLLLGLPEDVDEVTSLLGI